MNKNTSKNSKGFMPLIIAGALVLVLIIAVIAVTIGYSNSDTILKGVSVSGADLSGLTVSEAKEKVNSLINASKDKMIKITAGSDTMEATFSELGASFDSALTAEKAYAYGHDGFFSSVVPSIKALFGIKTDLDLSVYVSGRTFDAKMSEFTDYDKSVQASYEFTEGAIKVTNGRGAYTINPVTAKETLENAMKNLDYSPIVFTKENIAPIPFDITEIIENYSEEAVSATYYRDTDGSIKVTEGSDKVVVDEKKAEEIIASHVNPGESFDIPAKIDFAEHTYDELTEALFRDVLGTHTTSYASSNANRSHNVALAASGINEKILLPGESLSYNDTLGRRTPEAGYKMAGAYSNGETVQEYGGGICQISSTLYVAVLKSNLKIEDRTCHMFTVAYVPLGLDATVDYGTVDFVFSNDTEYPIKVLCRTTPGKQAICEILGTKTENFEVTFETTGVSSVPFPTEIEEDPTMPVGTEEIVEKGSNGLRCTTYRVVSVDGEVVSRTKESQSYYMPHKEVKKVGTMPVETDPTLSPEITSPEVGVTPPVTAPETQAPVTPPETTPVTPETPSEPASPAVSEL